MDISAASQREREKEGEIENQIPGLDYVTGSYLEWSVEYLERALSTDHRTTVAFGFARWLSALEWQQLS